VVVGTYSSIFVASPILTLLAGDDHGKGATQVKTKPADKPSVSKQGAPA